MPTFGSTSDRRRSARATGGGGARAAESARHAVVPPVPPADRAERPGWRDARIVLGLLLVAACMLIGAKVVSAADDTVGVWAARADQPAGAVLHRQDLRLVRVHFADAGLVGHYLVRDELPTGSLTLVRPVAAGELLPRAALGSGGEPVVEVPLEVAPGDLPATVRPGSVVDVWAKGDERTPARRVLKDVVVVALPSPSDSLAPESSRQVIVGVPEGAAQLGSVLRTTGKGGLVLTQRSRAVVQP